MALPVLTLAATVVTLTVVTLFGIWYSRGRIDTVDAFVRTRDTAGITSLTASLVASTLGTWVLFSPAEAGVSFGGVTAVLGYALGLALSLAVFVVVGVRIRELVPRGHSVTEYVLARYGRWMYAFVLVVSTAYMFVFLAVELTGVAAALSIVAGVPPPLTAGLIGFFVFVYTGFGGLIASIVTDTLQCLVMLPLLAAGAIGVILSLGGTAAIHARVVATDPTLLSVTNDAGLRFGLYVGLALLGGTTLNQGLWQRVYAARDARTLRRAFGVAAVAVVPVVFLAGLFGVGAVGLNLVEHGGHGALFRVLLATEPTWLTLVVVVVTVLLVTSSADTLVSGLTSLVLRDLSRLLDRIESVPVDHEREMLLGARLFTGVVALAASVVGAMQYSEIRLFLTVDLLSVATFVPVIAGLYSGRIPEWGAVTAALVGFLVGLLFDPVFRWLWLALLPAPAVPLLPQPSFVMSFTTAVVVSACTTVLSALVTDERTDLDYLERRVRHVSDDTSDDP